MKIDIPAESYQEIEALIQDAGSPVGIDAKKTHIIIIHELLAIAKRLDRIERRLED